MPSAAGVALGLRGSGRGFGAAARFGSAARFGGAIRFRTAGFRALAFRTLAFRAPTLGAGARFLTAAVFAAGARDRLFRDFLAGEALAGAGFFRAALERTFAPGCLAACAALAFFRACLAAFLLAFANFRARLNTAFASRTCRFAVAALAAALFAWARRRCGAADGFAPRS
jgi:hypothetical protein